jgi:putative membrane protein
MPIMNGSKIWLKLGIAVVVIAAGFLFLSHWGYGPMNRYNSWWPMSQGGRGGMMAYGGGWGMGSGMGIGTLLFWGIIVVAIVLVLVGPLSATHHSNTPAGQSDDALEILKKRYARGDIDKTEFDAKRRDLNA